MFSLGCLFWALIARSSPLTRFRLDAQPAGGGFETSHIVVADLDFFPFAGSMI